jgi:hypothetical protein
MSVLSFPRLYFQGYLSWDPDVTNNDPDLWDPVNVNVVLPPNVQLDTYQQYVIDNAASQNLGDWNIYGTHACNFVQYQSFTSAITGGSTGNGTITKDAVIGQQLSMPGRLVDLDPRIVDTSQYFFDQFTIGSSGTSLVSAPCAQRMHSRWINFNRNFNITQDPRIQIAGIAAVVWQTTFPTASLKLGSTGSPLLTAFANGMKKPGVQGMMVRFVVYRTLYFQNGVFNNIAQTPQNINDLQTLYQQGLMFSNPAYSVVTGSVGLWMQNEVPSVPGGRYLVPNEGTQKKPTGLGPVVAEFDSTAKLLSLDFGSAIPETDYNLDKQSFGALTVSAGGTQVATISAAQYASAAYQATGGIIDLPITNASAMSGLLSITGTLNGSPITMYKESQFSAQTDTKNMYLDEKDNLSVSVYVADQGKPAAAGTLVQVAQYKSTEANPTVLSPPLKVGANGLASFSIKATQPGYSYYRFAPYKPTAKPPKPPLQFDNMTDFYCGARTLPFDDELNANTPDSMLTWNWIYTNILQPFNLCPAAAMAAIGIALSDQSIWDNPSGAAKIKARTAASNFASTGYMPVTRELSNGMRNLLQRWADLVISGKAPAAVAAEAAEVEAINPPRRRRTFAMR